MLAHSRNQAAAPNPRRGEVLAASGAMPPVHPLPEWADNPEGRAILARIRLARPAARSFDNGCSAYGGVEYAGRDANKLRELFRPYESRLIAECNWGSPDYEARREAIISYIDANGPDALIRRVLNGGA